MSKAVILIVEDEAIIAADLANKLRELDYEVLGITARGEEAVALASARHPDLVLMDIRLAGAMDGVAAAEAIRRDCDLPVVYLTAHSDRPTLQRAKLTDPFGYILKPFEERELETHIEMALYKHQADRKLREQREWLRVTLTSIGDAVIATDTAGRITFLNPVAEALTGWRQEEALGQPIRSVFRIVNEQTRQPAEDLVVRVLREGRVVNLANHTALITRDGLEIPIEDSAAPIRDGAGSVSGTVLVFHDVTEQRKREEELRKLNRTLRALSNSNQALMHATEESEFLEQVCQIVVKDCGYEMVWIGFAEEDTARTVRPVAHAGFEDGYLETMNLTWADTERGRGPTGTAIRTGKPSLCANMLTDPKFAPWRAEAIKRGYASSLVLPLAAGGKVFGVLNIYSKQPAGFSEDEVTLLGELAADLAYGIAAIRLRRAHQQAEAAVRRAKEEWERTFDAVPDLIAILDREHRILRVNRAMAERLERTPEQCAGLRCYECVHGTAGPPPFCPHACTVRNGRTHMAEVHEERLGGDFLVTTTPLADDAGGMAGAVHVAREITDRVRAEQALRESEERYRGLVELAPDAVLVHRDAEILYANDAALRLYGAKSFEQLCGRDAFALVHPDERETVRARMRKVQEGGFAPLQALRHVRLDGQEVPVETTAAPTFWQGKPAVQVVVRDMTERKRAEAEIQSLARFPAENPNPVLRLSGEGVILYANEVAAPVLAAWQCAVGDPAPDPWPETIRDAQASPSGRTIDLRCGERTYLIFIAPVPEARYVNLYASDITDLRRSEAALRQAHDKLEEAVRERTAELSQALRTLQMQAGQLRTLAAELTMAEQRERRRLAQLLHDGLQQLLVAARLRAYMFGRSEDPEIRQGSKEIVGLLEEALTDARTLTGELSPPTLLTAGLPATLEWLGRWMLDKHQLTVRFQPPTSPLPPLPDELSVLLYQAVRELLLNTVKHAQVPAAEVALAHEGDRLRLTVADAGIGFDPGRLRVEGGTDGGFGLFGIRERLGLLGGRLEIASAPGRGSRFTLIAPLPPAAPAETPARAAKAPASAPARDTKTGQDRE